MAYRLLADEFAQAGKGGVGFAAFGSDEIEQLGRGARVFLGFAVGVDGFKIVGGRFYVFGFGCGFAGLAPASVGGSR